MDLQKMKEILALMIKHYESLHDGDLKMIGLQPKLDPANIWTEGYGHAMIGPDGKFLKGIENKAYAYAHKTINNVDEALKTMLEDIKPIILQLNRKISVSLNEFEMAALADHTYNTGGSATIFSIINKRDQYKTREAYYSELESWWTTHYITGQGNPKPLPGLIARRKTEITLFKTNVLKFYN